MLNFREFTTYSYLFLIFVVYESMLTPPITNKKNDQHCLINAIRHTI